MTNLGKFIVIEGIDGSGKGTQVAKLVERLKGEGAAVEMLDFPQYDKPSSYFVSKFLRGEYGTAAEVGPYRGSVFYALDRYEASFQLKEWLAAGKLVIANRYVSASMGHQTAAITGKEDRDRYLDWLYDLEYNIFNIPKPDATVLLYVPPAIGQQLVDKKQVREYTGGQKRDILEADLSHLEKAAEAYRYVAEKYSWQTIDCVNDNEMRSIEDIHEEVYALVKKITN